MIDRFRRSWRLIAVESTREKYSTRIDVHEKKKKKREISLDSISVEISFASTKSNKRSIQNDVRKRLARTEEVLKIISE